MAQASACVILEISYSDTYPKQQLLIKTFFPAKSGASQACTGKNNNIFE
jgi:hypothetical protein